LSIFLVVAGSVCGQQTTATFYAVATDSSGAMVPGATVKLTHEGTGAATTKITSAIGEAVFDFVRVGSYTVRIEASGFKRLESKGLELTGAQNIRPTCPLEGG